MKKKIIFCDIDGTIVDSRLGPKTPSIYTRYAFEELKKDHFVFICSGRTRPFLEPYILDLDPHGFILANGGLVEIGGESIYEQPFTDELSEKIRVYCRENDNGMYLLEHKDYIETGDFENPNFKAFYNHWMPMKQASFSLKSKGDPAYISIVRFATTEEAVRFEEFFRDDFDCKMHRGLTSFDVNLIGINKGSGMKEAAKALGISMDDTIAFGDADNDLEMIESAGTGVAMGNASQAVKKIADAQTDAVNEEGFYKYLIRNSLIKEMPES